MCVCVYACDSPTLISPPPLASPPSSSSFPFARTAHTFRVLAYIKHRRTHRFRAFFPLHFLSSRGEFIKSNGIFVNSRFQWERIHRRNGTNILNNKKATNRENPSISPVFRFYSIACFFVSRNQLNYILSRNESNGMHIDNLLHEKSVCIVNIHLFAYAVVNAVQLAIAIWSIKLRVD